MYTKLLMVENATAGTEIKAETDTEGAKSFQSHIQNIYELKLIVTGGHEHKWQD